jgi:hypothetical protein
MIRRKTPKFAANRRKTPQTPQTPQNTAISRKTPQFPAKRRKTPQDVDIRRKKLQFAAKCSSTFKQISQMESGNFSNSEKFP